MIDESKFEKLEKEDLENASGGIAYRHCTEYECRNPNCRNHVVTEDVVVTKCPKCGGEMYLFDQYCKAIL